MKVPSFELSDFPSMVNPRVGHYLIIVNSDVMAIGGGVSLNENLRNTIIPVEMYSNKKKCWQLQFIQIEEKHCF